MPFTAACVQMNSEREIAPNLVAARDMGMAARDAGADFILYPENAAMLEPRSRLGREKAALEAEHEGLAAFKNIAKETGAWVLVGSLAVRMDGEERIANRSYLLDADGGIVARYDKIHMFDVDLGGGESYRESKTYRPGDAMVLAETPWGMLGMTVCYDLRFPHLFRKLAQAGADFLAVPAAFTRVTGMAHWHVLLRARAIENGCFVLAPGQCGTHAEGRETFGHSLIVAPWGEVLADGGTEPGVVAAEIDLARVEKARGKIPSLTHDRDFS